MPPRTFYCPVGIAFYIPLEWKVSGFQGTEAHFKAPDETDARRDVLRLLVLGAESNTLGLALNEVKWEAWGREFATQSRCAWASLSPCAWS